jgi:hypothetical protein
MKRDRGDTYSERSRGITGSSPASAAVKSHTLVGNNLEEATAAESLGVRLTLDLQDIQGEENDFTNTDQTVQCQPIWR